MSNKKIKIGLTGGIGVGKTYVGQIFIKLGYPVFNADIEAKECIQKNETNKSFCVDILLWIGIFSNTIEFVKISKQNNVNVNKPLSKAVETKLKAMYFIE